MGRTKALQVSADARRKRQKAAAVVAAIAGGAVVNYMIPHLIKTPMYNSRFSGIDWFNEILNGHPVRFYNAMGMSKHVFRALLRELRMYCGFSDSKYIMMEEQLAIFVHMLRTGAVHRDVRERFQHSPGTISVVFTRLLDLVIARQFYSRYVKLPRYEQTPPEIHDNPKWYPYFKNCRGAIDGTHVDAFVPDVDVARYRDRYGGLSQNVLAVCTFDMRFAYVLAGWEGSAADGRVFEDARRNDLAIPPGSYYLADAGFPTCDSLVVPYRGARYHLREWARAPQKPRNYKELFNLRHASARNIIERTFGVVKRRFRIMTSAPQYSLEKQAKLVLAICVLHNFIRVHDPDDMGDQTSQEQERVSPRRQAVDFGGSISSAEKDRADKRRDEIAKAMWNQYTEV